MFEILYNYPLAGVLFLLLSAVISIMFSSYLYVNFNKQLLSVHKKKNKGFFKNLLQNTYRKIDIFDRDNKIEIYNTLRLYLKRSGYYKSTSVIVYLMVIFVFPLLLFIYSMLVYKSFLSSIFISLYVVLFVTVIIYSKKKGIEKEWKMNGYMVYRFIFNQVSSGISIHATITNLYLEGIGTKIEKPLFELSARYARTLDIKHALEEFKKYFSLAEIDMFCNTLEQGVRMGDVENLLFRQEQTMFRQYFNIIQQDTKNSSRITAVVLVTLFSIMCLLMAIPLLLNMNDAVNIIFGK